MNWTSRLRKFLSQRLVSVGNNFFMCSRYEQARHAFNFAFVLDPENIGALCAVGDVHYEVGDVEAAAGIFEDASRRDPACLHAFLFLTHCYLEMQEASRALEAVRRAAELAPDSLPVVLMLGRAYRDCGSIAEAESAYEHVLRNAPDCLDVHLFYGELCSDTGRKPEAITWFERANGISEADPRPYASLASLRYYSDPSHPHIGTLTALAGDSRFPRAARASMNFVLGSILDHLGLWDDAFRHFETANALTREEFPTNFSRKALGNAIQIQIESYHSEWIDRVKKLPPVAGSEKLIFIVGMPRSGTTLAEQIISSVPGVRAGGERLQLPRLVRSLSSRLGNALAYPACICRLDGPSIRRIAEEYLETAIGTADAPLALTDKLPTNYWDIGLIKALFPAARIVHCRRDPLDTCLSCFFQDFSHHRLSSLDEIGHTYGAYALLMKHWHDLLGPDIFELRYESLILNSDEVMKSLVGYCGLRWSDRCASFHESTTSVKTASRWQVKRPLYGTSAGRRENYRAYTKDLRAILGIYGCS